MKFKVIIKEDLEDGGYNVSCPDYQDAILKVKLQKKLLKTSKIQYIRRYLQKNRIFH